MMTEQQAAEAIARHNAEQAAAQDARRAAITPHVLRPPKKKPGRMSGPRYFNLMRAIENNPGQYADYRPTTYCGAPRTSEDWDRRPALAMKNAALVLAPEVTQPVCADCLRIAREESRNAS